MISGILVHRDQVGLRVCKNRQLEEWPQARLIVCLTCLQTTRYKQLRDRGQL